MKDQYFGDQTDYIKYGILRAFAGVGLPVAVHWTRTRDDESTDGSRTRYLRNIHQWRHYDPVIFDAIVKHLNAGRRDLNIVEEEGFVPGARFCYDNWTSDGDRRLSSMKTFLDKLEPTSLVFLDPDNGIEVPSARPGSTMSSKYVYMNEISLVWEHGHSFLIYQHFPRVKRVSYTQNLLLRLSERFKDAHTAAILTSHVAFLFCLQSSHAVIGIDAIRSAANHWAPATSALATASDIAALSEPAASSGAQLDLPL